MFVSTMFVILCVPLYLRDGGACIYESPRYTSDLEPLERLARKPPAGGIARSTNRPLRECVTLQPL